MATQIIMGESMVLGYVKFYAVNLSTYVGLNFVQIIQDWDWFIKLILSGLITTLFFIAQYEYKKWRDRNK